MTLPEINTSNYLTQAAADARYQAVGSIGAGTPNTIEPDDAAAAGVSTSVARVDHEHAIVAGTPVGVAAVAAEGAATSFSRSDHVHPGGQLGYAQAVASQDSITTLVDLTNLSAPVTVAADRRVRISAQIWAKSTVAADVVRLHIRESTTDVQLAQCSLPSAGTDESVPISVAFTPSAGAHTYKLSLERVVGTGTVTMSAGSANIAYILVEDIGAA